MNTRTLAGLIALTVLVIVALLLIPEEHEGPVPQSGQPVFPELLARINDVAELIVKSKDGQVTIVRGEDAWHVKEKEGYEAAMEKVKQAIIGVAELKYFEPKTTNPERYEKLGLLDPDAENSTSKQLILKDAEGKVMANLIIGNQRPARGNPRVSEIYIRKPDDPQAWLAMGSLPVETLAAEWLDQEPWAIETDRIRRVTVRHADGETVTIEKSAPEDSEFVLVRLPKGAKVRSAFTLDHMASTLGKMRIEDVARDSEIDFTKPDVLATLETFDGLRLTVRAVERDKKHFIKAAVEFDPALVYEVDQPADPKEAEASPNGADTEGSEATEADDDRESSQKAEKKDAPRKLKTPDEVEREVARLQKKLNGWVFEVSKFRIENFAKRMKDLIEHSS
ncbi:MAG: DUF4340 domain-containing protein [Nitrospirae bacterium]|nr:MAG: DUF4340 domain-containing protein [Nitrospirota bacterium]